MDHRGRDHADADRFELDSRLSNSRCSSAPVILSEGAGPSRKTPTQPTLQRAAAALLPRIAARAFDLSCHATGYLSHPCLAETRPFLRWLLVLLGIQLIRPTRTNPPVDPQRELAAHSQLPPQVASALNRSCNDCHSYRTTWPWYSQIAPFSWVITDDVNQGRRHVNFSDWGQYDPKRADHKLDQICEEVRGNWMPSNVLQTCASEFAAYRTRARGDLSYG